MKLIPLNRHRDQRPAKVGPAVSWPRTEEQAERLRAALAHAKDSGELDLADFYAFQLSNFKLANMQTDPGSAA